MFRIVRLINKHRNHHGAETLVRSLPHDTAHRLNNVHHRTLGVDEGDAVKRRHIDTLAEAGTVRQDTSRIASPRSKGVQQRGALSRRRLA